MADQRQGAAQDAQDGNSQNDGLPDGERMAAADALFADMAHWNQVIARVQAMLIGYAAETIADPHALKQSRQLMEALYDAAMKSPVLPLPTSIETDPERLLEQQGKLWLAGLDLWQDMFRAGVEALTTAPGAPVAGGDRRFTHEGWARHPGFAWLARTYAVLVEQMAEWADTVEGLDPELRERLRFSMRGAADAAAPTNFLLTNPAVIERMIETRGESLVKGLANLLRDLKRGQLTHSDTSAFRLGENIAATPGKVIYETPQFQLIHYAPTTERVLKTPLIIFPPWINRFYILDLSPKKSFVKWCVDQGISLFMVSWRSADATMADIDMEDYVKAQVDAIDQVRALLDVPSVHTIGYCVAGTTLAATLAWLAARGEADKVASSTFFTAQVDFTEAGDLLNFTTDTHLEILETLYADGVLDGRYLAATFNALRSRDLIWNYVVSNYLMGEDYPTFDLLHWNGDVTNLPATWHRGYIRNLYRQNMLAIPGAIRIDDTPIDLGRIETPLYIQAGREDHIAPAASVWKIRNHARGPIRFVLAGSGHIAGVVNPPESGKYQYWTNEDASVATLEQFVAGAQETPGSWWPDWHEWLSAIAPETIKASGARKPGKGRLAALEDAPGRYVAQR